jgi:hypothetical protein
MKASELSRQLRHRQRQPRCRLRDEYLQSALSLRERYIWALPGLLYVAIVVHDHWIHRKEMPGRPISLVSSGVAGHSGGTSAKPRDPLFLVRYTNNSYARCNGAR